MRQYVGPPTVAAIAQMLKGGVQVNATEIAILDVVNLTYPLQELIAKGVIEGLETEEEEEEVMKGGILEVAEICNQNHFSGKTSTLGCCCV